MRLVVCGVMGGMWYDGWCAARRCGVIALDSYGTLPMCWCRDEKKKDGEGVYMVHVFYAMEFFVPHQHISIIAVTHLHLYS